MTGLVPPYPAIWDLLHRGKVIPFLGAGASVVGHETGATHADGLPAHLPSGANLARDLAKQTKFPADEILDLAKVAEYYRIVLGLDSLKDKLHSIFDREYPLTTLHLFLAEIPTPLLIVTTNYDDLIERAFLEKGRACDVVIHTTDPSIGDKLLWWPHGETVPKKVIPNKWKDIDLDTRTVIYKMHGSVDRRQPLRDQYVISEEDYVDFLARMTKNLAIPAIFAEPFQSHHFLFLGYGLRDWNFRVVLNQIEKQRLRGYKSVKSWAIQHKPTLLEHRFWLERGVEVYDISIDQFVAELAAL
jgi:hypothetical protein